MKSCPNCYTICSDESRFCVKCGRPLEVSQPEVKQEGKKTIRPWHIVLIIFLIIAIIGISVGVTVAVMTKAENANESLVENQEEEIQSVVENNFPEEPGVFKIGGIGPLSGIAYIYGTSVQYGAKLAVDEINANGGINGHKIEFMMIDDAHDADTAVSAYNTLKDWGMQMLVGTVTSLPCERVSKKAALDGMFMITPSASKDSIILQGDGIYSVCYTDSDNGKFAARYIVDNKLASKVAVIYDFSDSYSVNMKNAFLLEAEEKGLDVVALESISMYSNYDLTSQLTACMSAGAELIFIPVAEYNAKTLLTQAARMNYSPVFFGVDSLDNILQSKDFDISLAEGLYMMCPYTPSMTSPEAVSFTEKFTDFAGVEYLNQYAADGYDAIYAIKAAVENGNISPYMTIGEIRTKMIVAMSDITINGVTGKNMSWNSDGTVDKNANVVIVKNGKFVSP